MASTNKNKVINFTHEGATAKNIKPYQELRRTVMSCLLWEKSFYESGESVADRIKNLARKVTAEELAEIAFEARDKFYLRHVPLLLARELARHPGVRERNLISETICNVIQRADELTEFLSIYWLEGKTPISAQVKKGLAKAFVKFNAYALAKYNRDTPVKLRDVLFLSHAKPKDHNQKRTWEKLISGTLESPDTWEVSLSSGADKREVFERLLLENKLGYMALLKNLRNMQESGVDKNLVESKLLEGAGKSKTLPFRYLSAAKACPQWERMIDSAMIESMKFQEKLTGKTIVLMDVSASMDYDRISKKSEVTRRQAGAALCALVAGISDDLRVFVFAEYIQEVPHRQGMAMVDLICSARTGWTRLGEAVSTVNTLEYDRLIVFTDEQSHDKVPDPKGYGYMCNVATYKNGVGYGKWVHIDGFSESVIAFIQEIEKERVF